MDSARLVEIGHQKYSMLDSKEEQVIDEDLDFELIGEVQLRLGPLLDPKKELVIDGGLNSEENFVAQLNSMR